MLENAAVFINAVRKFKNVFVEFDAETVTVRDRIKKSEIATFEIAEVAKDGMAWDVLDGRGDRVRLVAQTGCGCSGMKAYNNDESYSGALKHK